MFANLGLAPKREAEQLEAMPPFPFELEYLWDLFFEFAAGLVSSGMAPAQASWLDLQAFCAAMRLELEPAEARILISLANLRAGIQAEAQSAKSKARGKN